MTIAEFLTTPERPMLSRSLYMANSDNIICCISLDSPNFYEMFIPKAGYTWYGKYSEHIIKIVGSSSYLSRTSSKISTWTMSMDEDADIIKDRHIVFNGKKLFTIAELFDGAFLRITKKHPELLEKLKQLYLDNVFSVLE